MKEENLISEKFNFNFNEDPCSVLDFGHLSALSELSVFYKRRPPKQPLWHNILCSL